MITNNTQVRLTIELEGRLGAKASNAGTKKDLKLMKILEKKGKSFYSEYTAPQMQSCSQTTTLSSDCVHFYASEEGRPIGVSPSNWKRLKPIQKLEYNLQLYAEAIAQKNGVKFSYSLIN